MVKIPVYFEIKLSQLILTYSSFNLTHSNVKTWPRVAFTNNKVDKGHTNEINHPLNMPGT